METHAEGFYGVGRGPTQGTALLSDCIGDPVEGPTVTPAPSQNWAWGNNTMTYPYYTYSYGTKPDIRIDAEDAVELKRLAQDNPALKRLLQAVGPHVRVVLDGGR